MAAERIVWIRGLVPDPDLPFHRRCYEEPLVEAPTDAVSAARRPAEACRTARAVVRTEPGRDVSILLDFGKIMTGRPWFEIEARGGEIIEIACAEGLPGEWRPGGPAADARPTPKPWLGADAHLCRYRAKAGRAAVRALRMVRHPLDAGHGPQCAGGPGLPRPGRQPGQLSGGGARRASPRPTRCSTNSGPPAPTPCGSACTTPGRTARAASSGSGWAT